MKLVIPIVVCSMLLAGCNIQNVRCTNPNYDNHQQQDAWNVDNGRCNQEAMGAYPEPSPGRVRRKITLTNRYGTTTKGYSRKSSGLNIKTIEVYDNYSNYKRAKRSLPGQRDQYVRSCMTMRGWQSHVVDR